MKGGYLVNIAIISGKKGKKSCDAIVAGVKGTSKSIQQIEVMKDFDEYAGFCQARRSVTFDRILIMSNGFAYSSEEELNNFMYNFSEYLQQSQRATKVVFIHTDRDDEKVLDNYVKYFKSVNNHAVVVPTLKTSFLQDCVANSIEDLKKKYDAVNTNIEYKSSFIEHKEEEPKKVEKPKKKGLFSGFGKKNKKGKNTVNTEANNVESEDSMDENNENSEELELKNDTPFPNDSEEDTTDFNTENLEKNNEDELFSELNVDGSNEKSDEEGTNFDEDFFTDLSDSLKNEIFESENGFEEVSETESVEIGEDFDDFDELSLEDSLPSEVEDVDDKSDSNQDGEEFNETASNDFMDDTDIYDFDISEESRFKIDSSMEKKIINGENMGTEVVERVVEKVKVVEKPVEKIVEKVVEKRMGVGLDDETGKKIAQENMNRLGKYTDTDLRDLLNGKVSEIFIMTGDMNVAPKYMMEYAKYISSSTRVLCVDLDSQYHSLLSQFEYSEIVNQNRLNKSILSGIKNVDSLSNFVMQVDGVDLLALNYGVNLNDKELIKLQRVVSEMVLKYSIIFVNIPMEDLCICKDLFKYSIKIVCVEQELNSICTTVQKLEKFIIGKEDRQIFMGNARYLSKITSDKFDLDNTLDKIDERSLMSNCDWLSLQHNMYYSVNVRAVKELLDLMEE